MKRTAMYLSREILAQRGDRIFGDWNNLNTPTGPTDKSCFSLTAEVALAALDGCLAGEFWLPAFRG